MDNIPYLIINIPYSLETSASYGTFPKMIPIVSSMYDEFEQLMLPNHHIYSLRPTYYKFLLVYDFVKEDKY